MPKHHTQKSHRKHASGRRHKHAASASANAGHHRKHRRHANGHGLPAQLREKLQQPVTVKTLHDIVALRRVQRGA